MREEKLVEEVAKAIYAVDIPSGDWTKATPDGRKFWMVMARTCISVDMWGGVKDCAMRLATWDDIDRRREPRRWDDRSDRLQDLWMRRAKAGWAVLHPAVDSEGKAELVSDA